MTRFTILALILLGGCATEVYHPARSRDQAQKDIRICHDHGTLSSPYNPVVALRIANECLDKKGYIRRTPADARVG